LVQGEVLKILVGQQSDHNIDASGLQGVGGSGGSFLLRQRDDYAMIVAGGGSSASGFRPSSIFRNHSDASLITPGNLAYDVTKPLMTSLSAQELGDGGKRGSTDKTSAPGGGAGLLKDGEEGFSKSRLFNDLNPPEPAIRFSSVGSRSKGPGVGGYFSYEQGGVVFTNNGGFGGGGSGSYKGGSGGGGGICGGSGGPILGWGGGGGSLNNGETKVKNQLHFGSGSVVISYIGKTCCGPHVVYITMSFIAGIFVSLLISFQIFLVKRKK